MMHLRDYSAVHRTDPNKRWCINCECWVDRSEMLQERLDDDRTIEERCPGCDRVLLDVIDDGGDYG